MLVGAEHIALEHNIAVLEHDEARSPRRVEVIGERLRLAVELIRDVVNLIAIRKAGDRPGAMNCMGREDIAVMTIAADDAAVRPGKRNGTIAHGVLIGSMSGRIQKANEA